jgi:NTP pyrophosphatase (non-canonical NTP hydrolase)
MINSIDQLNYEAVKAWGKITTKTKKIAFCIKLAEEVFEVFKAILKKDNDNYNEELGDVIVTATNALIHNGAKPTNIKHRIYNKNKNR